MDEQKEVEELAKEFKECWRILAEAKCIHYAEWMIKKGYTKRPQDNNICECGHPRIWPIYMNQALARTCVMCFVALLVAKKSVLNSAKTTVGWCLKRNLG